jgi:hypothetical protein
MRRADTRNEPCDHAAQQSGARGDDQQSSRKPGVGYGANELAPFEKRLPIVDDNTARAERQ